MRMMSRGDRVRSVHVIGAYAYHFWMAAMTPLRRVSGNQYLHRKSDAYRDAVRRKIAAYHRHIQLGLIAQGLLQILSATQPKLVWRSFGSWIRTIRPGLALRIPRDGSWSWRRTWTAARCCPTLR